jgi:hypothetical protein
VYTFLADNRQHLFPPELFADVARQDDGHPSVPAKVVATVMVLQALDGLSDREAASALRRGSRRANGGDQRLCVAIRPAEATTARFVAATLRATAQAPAHQRFGAGGRRHATARPSRVAVQGDGQR